MKALPAGNPEEAGAEGVPADTPTPAPVPTPDATSNH
jgi:hypothetical protein